MSPFGWSQRGTGGDDGMALRDSLQSTPVKKSLRYQDMQEKDMSIEQDGVVDVIGIDKEMGEVF